MRQAFTVEEPNKPHVEPDEVAIYDAKTRLVLGKLANLNSGKDGDAEISSEYLMPEDIYDFLKIGSEMRVVSKHRERTY